MLGKSRPEASIRRMKHVLFCLSVMLTSVCVALSAEKNPAQSLQDIADLPKSMEIHKIANAKAILMVNDKKAIEYKTASEDRQRALLLSVEPSLASHHIKHVGPLEGGIVSR